MRISQTLRLTAAAALSSVVATLAFAGPLAGSALAAQKQKAPLPSVTATVSSTDSTPLGSRTASYTAHFAWSVISGESYTCFLDGANKTNCTTFADYTNINTSGTHTFTIKVGKLTGYRPNTYIYTWVVDHTPPSSPPAVDPLPTPTSSTTANITFSKTDLSTTYYKCALDDPAPADATDCTSGWPLSGLSEQSHTAYVYALDDLRNMNTTPGKVTWVVDHTAPNSPTVSVTPVGPTSSTDATITWTDGDAVSFSCQLDNNTPVANCTTPWALHNLSEGTHVVAVTGTDAAGNVGTAGKVHWIVDLTPPPAPIISTGPASTTDNTMATFQFGDVDATATFTCKVDSTTTPGTYAPCTSPTTYLGPLADGNYLFSVRATDAAGNTGPANTWAWKVDTVNTVVSPPQIQTGPAPLTHDANPAFTFLSLDDPTASFLCAVDPADPSNQGAYATCSSGDSFPVSVDGAHTLYVEEVSGGVTSLPATWNWTLDSTPPPAPTFTAKPDLFINSTGALFNFSDTEANVSYVCQLDAQPSFPCVTPTSVTQLSEGAHTFTVSATDAAGNTSAGSTASYTWTVDLTPPAKPTVTGADPSGTTATLALSDTDGDVVGYRCTLDSSLPAACNASPSFSNLSGGSHTILVQAVDHAGNIGLPQSFTWTVDAGAPAAPTLTTVPGRYVNSPTADFAFNDPATTGDSHTVVTSFTCWLDGAQLPGCTSASYSGVPSGTMHLTGQPEGEHTFTVVGLNSLGNGTPTNYTFTVDVTAPVLKVTGLPGAGKVVNTPSITTTVTDNDVNSSGIYTCSLTGPGGYSSTDCSGATGLADGTYTFTADTTDLAGNAATEFTRTWTVDTVKPALTVTGLPAEGATVNWTSFTPSVTQTDANPGALVCALDGVAVGCADLGTVAEGAHTFTANTTDAAGNVADTVTVDFSVDRTGPASPDVSGTHGYVDSDTASFSYSDTSPDVATYSCSIDGAPVVECPASFPNLGQGAHSLDVTATDTTGNVGGTSTVTWTVDTIAPVLHVTGLPAENASVNWASFTPTVTQTESNPRAVVCALDGATVSCADLGGNVLEGAHTFTADTTDAAGNQASTVTVDFTVDRTAPAMPNVAGPSGIVNSSTASFGFTDTSSDTTLFSCSLDGAASVECPGAFPSLADGVHTLAVTASDAAGNVSPVRDVTWTIDTGAPTATITTPGTLTGAAVVTWSEPVSALDTSKVVVTETDSGKVVAAKITCLSGGTPASCAGTTSSLKVTPAGRFVPGQHYTVSVAADAAQDAASNGSVLATSKFRAQRTLQENVLPVAPAWQRAKAWTAYGHSYATEHLAGAQAAYGFRGPSITWWTMTGPTEGKAAVYVDGHRKAIVNNYAPETRYRIARTFKRLGAGRHVLTIRVLGVKGSTRATGTSVGIDAFTVGKKLTSSPRLSTTWHRLTSSGFYSRHAVVANLKGEAISLTFRGTSITFTTVRNRTQGKAAVYVDGVRKAIFDNYSTTSRSKVNRLVRGLTDTVHTVRIVVLGKHHKGGKGTNVTVDRFVIG
ncbi:MAG TPA: Ig-like domain repeat protein [Mycobacteriales bacterium]|nr:Ig-like domain repeat protein [Mycobacteriales bacterium]